MNDKKIIELFFDRSEKAVSELSKRYSGVILRIAQNLLHNRQDAEECENDTYLSIWNSVPPQRPESLTAFVCKIARNIAINRIEYDHAQKRGGQSEAEACFEELQECIPSGETAEARYEANFISELIDEFLDTLDKKNRMIFVRRYWYNDSFKDIAAEAELSEGTVRTRLTRLRDKLKDFLESRGVTV